MHTNNPDTKLIRDWVAAPIQNNCRKYGSVRRTTTNPKGVASLAAQGTATPPPLLLDATQLGKLLSCSTATIWRDLTAGRLPAPVVRGRGRTRWRYGEIVAWVDAGMPASAIWKSMQSQASACRVTS